MYQIISFYFKTLVNIFSVWTSWVLVPGLNYLIFILVCFLLTTFLRYFWKEREEDSILSRRDRAQKRRIERYEGKHTYKPKHGKVMKK